jgi:hypothetical protein
MIEGLKTCKKCGEARPRGLFSRRSASADGLAFVCRDCQSVKAKARYLSRLKGQRAVAREKDPEGYLCKQQKSYAARVDKIAEYRKSNKELAKSQKATRKSQYTDARKVEVTNKGAAYLRKWRAENPERSREYRKAWDQQNRDKVCLYAKRRRVGKIRQQPPWADEIAIAAVYRQARDLTDSTGVPHDVDHVYALRGRTVSGLHVHHNLRPLPASVNGSKLNKLPGTLAHELWDPTGPGVFHG